MIEIPYFFEINNKYLSEKQFKNMEIA